MLKHGGCFLEVLPPKAMIAAAVLLGVLEAVSGLAVLLLTMTAVNSFAAGGFSYTTLLLVALTLIGQAALGGLAYYLMSAIGGRIVAAIRERVWNHVLRLKVNYFDAHESGETMSRITLDTNVVRNLITNHIITFFTGLLSIVGAVAMLLWIDWKMMLVILLAAVLAVGVMLPIGNKMQTIALAHQDELAKFSGNLGRVLTNIRLVKAYQACLMMKPAVRRPTYARWVFAVLRDFLLPRTTFLICISSLRIIERHLRM